MSGLMHGGLAVELEGLLRKGVLVEGKPYAKPALLEVMAPSRSTWIRSRFSAV